MTLCLACGSGNVSEVLDLGMQSPVNNFGSAGVSDRTPLVLLACRDCGHAQQRTLVSPTSLFEDYLYASSTSGSLRLYAKALAGVVAQFVGGSRRILEIASNDGLFQEALRDLGLDSTGIDPAARMVGRARDRGLNAHVGYWPQDRSVVSATTFDLVIGQNVLAHTPAPLAFLRACREVLDDNGLAIFQTSQADMVANGEFDTVYHEHFSFFCEDSARALGQRAGFESFSASYSRIHGNSALFVFGSDDSAVQHAAEAMRTSSGQWSEWVAESGPDDSLRRSRPMSAWRAFSSKAVERMEDVRTLVSDARKAGRRIVAVGAAAKAVTFLRAADISVDLLVDEAVDKIGRRVDGLDVTVQHLASAEYRESDMFIITAWNFAVELSGKLVAAGARPSSPTCVYFPVLRVGDLAGV